MKIEAAATEGKKYDLCIAGTGPAGIILALEYQKLRPKNQVLLIEYGKDGATDRNFLDDSIKVMEPRNHHLPYECTNKGLGGSSASWGGRCVMYDEVDFLPRKILKGQCTWDVGLYQECGKYLNQTAEYFECGDGRFDLKDITEFAGSRIAERFQSGDVIDSVIERWSMPTRFRDRYAAQIDTSPTLHLLTGWEAFSLGAKSQDGGISEIGIRDFSRRRSAKVLARKVVIAA
jgi:choline dehydrogenase-like flavoprotein